MAFGAPQYENGYTYNGESYNPNIQSQYLRARYYCVVTAAFITEDSYLGDILEPLTLNRYNYCLSNYLNYADPSGHWLEILNKVHDFFQGVTAPVTKSILDTPTALFYPSLILDETLNQGSAGIRRRLDNYDLFNRRKHSE